MMVLLFSIFRGRFGDKDVVWLGAYEGLTGARDRMLQIAAKQPGAYFVLNLASHSLTLSLDTAHP